MQQCRQEEHVQTGHVTRGPSCGGVVGNRDEESFLDQLTECLCPIPIITYPQDVLLAVQREPEQKKERRKDSRNVSKRSEAVTGRRCRPTDLPLSRH